MFASFSSVPPFPTLRPVDFCTAYLLPIGIIVIVFPLRLLVHRLTHRADPCIIAFDRPFPHLAMSYNTGYGSAMAMDIDYNYKQSIETNYLETLEKIRYQLNTSIQLHSTT